MKTVTLQIPEYVYDFYQKVGAAAGGIPVEKVMANSLFKLAGELSLNAMEKRTGKSEVFP